VTSNSARRRNNGRANKGRAGFGLSGTLILMVGCLVVGALVAVAVMGGLDASKNNAQANTAATETANVGTTAAPAASAQTATTQRVTTTTQRVTTTTSRAAALAVLRSRVVVAPANGTARWSLEVPVSVHATGARLEKVHITGGPGTHVLAGAIDPYTGVFRSTGTLYPSTTYTVSFLVAGKVGSATGLTTVGTRTFTTPPPSAAESVTANVFPTPGISVGIGEPIIFMFSQPIDTYAAQQSVLSHLHISMSKPVPGGWHWFSSVELHFRPTHYWPVGEGVSVSGNLSDWDAGSGEWGVGALSTSFIVGESRVATVNLTTHEMTVTENGKVLYTWPISAGRVTDPSMDGTHIVMDRESEVDMNSATVGIPQGSPGAYNLKVYWDVHISDSGEYVHAAPWSVSSQGFQNVSHGCINLSPARADIFFHLSRVGDIVQVIGGPRSPVMGDHGVMDWSFGPGVVSWTPATVTPLTTSVTTMPTTTTPPPAGAPT
jgi:lipoprotein-anchoring transpeptidase ErfK/SrfK